MRHSAHVVPEQAGNRRANDYEIVDSPSAGTRRIRAAITEAEKSTVFLDNITTVIHVGLGA